MFFFTITNSNDYSIPSYFLKFLINLFYFRKKLLELENSSAIVDIGSESSSNEDDVIEICEDFDELKNEGVLVSYFLLFYACTFFSLFKILWA